MRQGLLMLNLVILHEHVKTKQTQSAWLVLTTVNLKPPLASTNDKADTEHHFLHSFSSRRITKSRLSLSTVTPLTASAAGFSSDQGRLITMFEQWSRQRKTLRNELRG